MPMAMVDVSRMSATQCSQMSPAELFCSRPLPFAVALKDCTVSTAGSHHMRLVISTHDPWEGLPAALVTAKRLMLYLSFTHSGMTLDTAAALIGLALKPHHL